MIGAGVVRALVGAVIVLLVLVMLVLSTLTGEGPHDPRSVRSRKPEGRLAATLLLDELGREARRFEAAPLSLPRPPALVWMPAAVSSLPDYLLADDAGGAAGDAQGPAFDDPRHPLFYRRFVEEGGTLVVPAAPHVRPFLEVVFGLEDPPLGTVLREASNEVRVRDEGPFAFAFPERLAAEDGPLRAPLPLRGPEALVVDGEGLVVALRVERGAGALVLLATDDFLGNAGLREADHALLFTRLVELLRPPGAPVHFDEFALGAWSPAGKLELAFGPGARRVTWQLLLLAVLWTWLHGWPREFPRDPLPLEQRSPLERARAQAGLLLRTGHHAHAARRLRDGVLRRLARVLRLPVRDVDQPAERAEALRRLAALGAGADAGRVEELFALRPVDGRGELERLGAELLELERRLLEGAGIEEALPAASAAGEDAAHTRSQAHG